MATVRLNDPSENRPEKLKPIVSREDITVEKSLGQKFKDTFISSSAKNIGKYLFGVFVDTLKNAVVDAVTMALLGDDRATNYRTSRRRISSGGDNTSYRSYYMSDMDDRYGAPPPSSRKLYSSYEPSTNYDYRRIIVNFRPGVPESKTREEAAYIVETMRNRIKGPYKKATVADLLELCGLPTARDGVDRNIGWTDPYDIDFRWVDTGYLIVVTDAKDIR